MKKKFIELRPFQETLNSGMCGPAALKIALDYYGTQKSEKELAILSNQTPELGTNEEGIKKAATELGFKVEIKNNASFEDIEKYIDKKIAVIVNWFTRGRSDYTDSDVSEGHYSVVSGLDDVFIYLQDPEIGKERKIKRNDFMKVWFDFKGEYIKENELIIRQLIAIIK